MKKHEMKDRIEELEYELNAERLKLDRVITYLSESRLECSAQEKLAELELGALDPNKDKLVYHMKQLDRAAARASVVMLKRALLFAMTLKED